MNTDKTLDIEFANSINEKYPIWYYKQLEETSIYYVLLNLLKNKFVVEIDGSKHEIMFGKNRKHEIWFTSRYDELSEVRLCSSEIIEKGFREGKWYIITDIDTTDEFKADSDKRNEEYEKAQMKEWYKTISKNAIRSIEDIDDKQRNKYINVIENSSYEELEILVNTLLKNNK